MSDTLVKPAPPISAATWEGYGCGAAAAAAESASLVAERAMRATTQTLDTVTRRGPKGTPIGERMSDAERETVRRGLPAHYAAIDLQLAAGRACGFSLLRNFP